MSELYQDPKKLKRDLAESTKTGNFLQDYFTDYISSGLSVGDDGKVKREGAAWWLQGLTPGSESIARQKEGIEEATAVRNSVVRSGLDEDTISETAGGRKLTSDNVTGILNTAKLNYQTPAQKEEAEQRKRANEANIKNAERQLDITEQTYKDNSEWRRFQAAENNKNRAEDRRLTAETNQMQLQLEYARLAQSERTRQQDRKDRAIMTLISGLGNLGAAFAI